MSELLEEQVTSTALRVDRQNGILKGVKLVGTRSKNGRVYPPAVLAKARALYEGRPIHIDHPESHNPAESRPIRDRIGWIAGVTQAADGSLVGDAYILREHPAAGAIFELAERNPSLVGMSHAAFGQTERRGDELVVTSIREVRSIDLVCDPAATSGLFEAVEHSPQGPRLSAAEVKAAVTKVLEGIGERLDAMTTVPKGDAFAQALRGDGPARSSRVPSGDAFAEAARGEPVPSDDSAAWAARVRGEPEPAGDDDTADFCEQIRK